MKKESSGATLMTANSSRAGAMFMKRKALELCHFHDGSAAWLPIDLCITSRNSKVKILQNLTGFVISRL